MRGVFLISVVPLYTGRLEAKAKACRWDDPPSSGRESMSFKYEPSHDTHAFEPDIRAGT